MQLLDCCANNGGAVGRKSAPTRCEQFVKSINCHRVIWLHGTTAQSRRKLMAPFWEKNGGFSGYQSIDGIRVQNHVAPTELGDLFFRFLQICRTYGAAKSAGFKRTGRTAATPYHGFSRLSTLRCEGARNRRALYSPRFGSVRFSSLQFGPPPPSPRRSGRPVGTLTYAYARLATGAAQGERSIFTSNKKAKMHRFSMNHPSNHRNSPVESFWAHFSCKEFGLSDVITSRARRRL